MFRKIIKNIALIITLIIIACYITGWMAQWVSPNTMVAPAYFVMVMPIWWILLIATIIFWLFRKKWVLSICLFALLALTFPQWRQIIVINNPFKTEQKEGISILSYNIHIFQNQSKFEDIINFIKEKDADILCLQEFGFFFKCGHNQKEILDSLHSIYPYSHIWYKNQNKNSWNGLATFSKYPIIKKKKIEYNSAHNISIYSDIIINKDTVRVINNHLESNNLNSKDRDFAKIITDEKSDKDEIIGVSKDVSFKLGTASKNRAKQAEKIREEIDKSPYKIIVAGDFNDVPASYTYQKIKGSLTDAFVQAGKWGYNWTYFEHHMLFAIDHIFIDKDYKAIQSGIIKVKHSDHYPIYTKIIKK